VYPDQRTITIAGVPDYFLSASMTGRQFPIPESNKHIALVNYIAPDLLIGFNPAAPGRQRSDSPRLRKQLFEFFSGLPGFEVLHIVVFLQGEDCFKHRSRNLEDFPGNKAVSTFSKCGYNTQEQGSVP